MPLEQIIYKNPVHQQVGMVIRLHGEM